jgi:hypothetical protein
MAAIADALQLDLVEWVAREPRLYVDVIESWRTSCPRLTIWEDCVDRGFLTRAAGAGHDVTVVTTPAGFAFLREHGRLSAIDDISHQ